MKVEVNTASFADAVAWTTSVIDARPANPILAGVKLEAADGTMQLSAFTYEISARDHIEAGVDESGTVVVLGSMGRNFGAGFSGGNVYVLDLDMNQVNPTAAKDGSLLFLPLDDEAQALVHDLVKRHVEETGSAFAAGLLKDWKHTVARFTHVVPEHYLAMTAAMAKAEEDNIDFNTPGAWEQVYEQVMEGAH